MKIYNEKQYIVHNPNEVEGLNAELIPGSKLREWLKDGSLKDGDQIYKATLIAVAVEKREIVLADVKGGDDEQDKDTLGAKS